MADKAKNPLMKDGLGAAAVERMAMALSKAWKDFPATAFRQSALRGLEDLELKQRVRHLIGVLRSQLPDDLTEALALLRRVPEHWHAGEPGDSMAGFAAWPLIDFVGEHGGEHFDDSMETMRCLTPLFSAEFAIRPFLERQPQRTLSRLAEWARDEDPHVRRLVSEGTRPRLPWGCRLRRFQEDPSAGLALLEILKDDPSEYVRRSVANHLNDIGKDHPERLVELCHRWSQQASPERRWILRHGLRSLIKEGHGGALRVLGYDPDVAVEVEKLLLKPPRLCLGESFELRFDVVSKQSTGAPLVIDYAVHHVKANGSTTPKVFKLKTVTLEPGQRLSVSKKHAVRRISTRTYYAGCHQVDVLLNGKCRGSLDLWLDME